MIDEKRKFIKELLNWDRRSARDLDKISRLLKYEAEAHVRRLRSQAFICLDDVAEYSRLLKGEFPELIYFLANYKTESPTPDKFPDDFPITIYATLLEAIEAAVEIGSTRPAFNGPNFNRPNIIARWPWPDELLSGDSEKLIGGREFPDSTFDLAIQYRDLGRWLMLRYQAVGYVDPRLPDRDHRPPVLDQGKLPVEAYPDMTVLKTIGSEFFTLYDLNDPETMAFAKRAHALWRRIATKQVSVYDPITREIVTPEDWRGTHHTPVGKRALEHGLETPPRYAAFAFSVTDGRRDGPALMIGPKPKRKNLAKTTK